MENNKLILIVDDNEAVLDILTEQIKHMGYIPLSASNENQALEFLRDNKGKILCSFVDYSLSNISGYELSCMLRDVDPDLKIVIMSGYDGEDISINFHRMRIEGFLQKPFTIKELKKKIEEI